MVVFCFLKRNFNEILNIYYFYVHVIWLHLYF